MHINALALKHTRTCTYIHTYIQTRIRTRTIVRLFRTELLF